MSGQVSWGSAGEYQADERAGKLMSVESVMPSSHLILCRPLLLLPPIPPSISGMWRLSSLTKDQACTPCSRGTDSSPLGRRGSPPVPLSHARAVSECLPTCCDSMFQVHLNISSAPALESTISARSLLVPFIGEEKIFASLSRVLDP